MKIYTQDYIFTLRQLKQAIRKCRCVADVNALRAITRPQSGRTELHSIHRWSRKLHKRHRLHLTAHRKKTVKNLVGTIKKGISR